MWQYYIVEGKVAKMSIKLVAIFGIAERCGVFSLFESDRGELER